MSTPWSEIMSVVQTPVSMRMPSSTSRMPPAMLLPAQAAPQTAS